MKRWSFLLLPLLLCAVPVQAQTITAINADDLAAFVDGIMYEQLNSDSLAGATVAVVQDGEVLLTKGYGWANVENEVPVSAETLFRIGSITKLFTWVSLMQLVEQGLVDLDVDINTYLDFAIPATYDTPIRVRDLMGHTPGFEDAAYGLTAPDVERLQTNGDWLKAHIPQRIYPPGEVIAYSNYGAGLGGYIVERVSGMPYADYVEANILQPLGMAGASMAQPLPGGLAAQLSTAYSVSNGWYEPGIFELFHAAPAGAGSASATAMSRFMLALLNDGGGILQPQTVKQMFSTLYRMEPNVNGYAYGWMEQDRGGERIVGHGGDTAFFHSLVLLVPERQLGLFVSYNTGHTMLQPYQFADALFERYLPLDSSYTPDLSIDLSPYVGSYRLARRNVTSAEKLLQLMTVFRVAAENDSLVVSGMLGPQRFQAVTPTLFHAIDGTSQLGFRLDGNGQPVAAALGDLPYTMLEPLAWYETPGFTLGLLGTILGLYALTLIAAMVEWIQRRLTHNPLPRAVAWLRARAFVVIALTMIFLLGFALPLQNTLAVMQGDVAVYRYVSTIPWLIALATGWILQGTWRIWRIGSVSILGRVHYTAVTIAALAFVGWMVFWQFFTGMP